VSRNPSILSQSSAGTSATLNAAYQGVFSQLDALASETISLSNPSSPALPEPAPLPEPAYIPPYLRGTGAFDLSPLEAVSERTEPLSGVPSIRSLRSSRSTGTLGSLTRDGSRKDFSAGSVGRRVPLPPSPVKGPRSELSASGSLHSTPQASPKKASDLIKMFESKGSGPPPPQPSFAPAAMSRTSAFAAAPTVSPGSSSSSKAGASMPIPAGAREPASLVGVSAKPQYTAPAPTAVAVPPTSYRPTDPPNVPEIPTPTPLRPFKPARSPSPISNFRSMVATWRARAGSPSQRVIGSPGQGGDTPRLFGRDRAWNVAIRRRKRDDLEDRNVLAEKSDEPEPAPPAQNVPLPHSEPSIFSQPPEKRDDEEKSSVGRGLSVSNFAESEPRQLTGEVSPRAAGTPS